MKLIPAIKLKKLAPKIHLNIYPTDNTHSFIFHSMDYSQSSDHMDESQQGGTQVEDYTNFSEDSNQRQDEYINDNNSDGDDQDNDNDEDFPFDDIDDNSTFPTIPAAPSYEFGDLNYWTDTLFPWSDNILALLRQHFGFESFRPIQKAVINATLSRRDVFLCIPTGSGKSLTFQLPAILNRGVSVVFMPLIALMQDQTVQLQSKNIPVLNLSGICARYLPRRD